MCLRFREKLGVKTVKALKRNNNGVTHAAVDMLCALMCVSIIFNIWKSIRCMHNYATCIFLFLCIQVRIWGKNSTHWNLAIELFSHVSLQPMHDDYDLRQEQLNKASLLSSKKFLENLLEKFITNVVHFLILSAILNAARAEKNWEIWKLYIIIYIFLFPKSELSFSLFFRTMEQELWSSAPYWIS